jgi:hypothetical protein
MSDALDRAFEVIDAHPDLADFVGSRDEDVVAAAEHHLGVSYPADYRRFLHRFGAGSFGAHEVYGVIHRDFSGPVPDGVWLTTTDRAGPSALPTTLIVIGSDGMGGSYVLDASLGDDPPVCVWQGGASRPTDHLEQVAPDFGTFLLTSVTAEAELA